MCTFARTIKWILLVAACIASVSSVAGTSPYTEVLFACEKEASVAIRFYTGKERAVLIREEQYIDLRQEPSASGFFYTNNRVSIRGKGDQLSIEIGRMAPLKCLAIQTTEAATPDA